METNKLKIAWIWIWYNDTTRFMVLCGVPVIPIIFAISAIFGSGEYLRSVAAIIYVSLLLWTIIDNDYSNLRRIGLDEHRKKITDTKKQ